MLYVGVLCCSRGQNQRDLSSQTEIFVEQPARSEDISQRYLSAAAIRCPQLKNEDGVPHRMNVFQMRGMLFLRSTIVSRDERRENLLGNKNNQHTHRLD